MADLSTAYDFEPTAFLWGIPSFAVILIVSLLSSNDAARPMAPVASGGTGAGRCFVVFQLQLEFRGTWSCRGFR